MEHEAGHVIAAQCLGHETVLHFGSMDWGMEDSVLHTAVHDVAWRLEVRAERVLDGSAPGVEPGLASRALSEMKIVTLGGPLANMLLGTVGIVWLVVLCRRSPQWGTKHWIAAILALFWSRQLFNLMTWLIMLVANRRPSFRADEIQLALYYDLPLWSVSAVTAAVAAIVCVLVVRLVPRSQRHILLLAAPPSAIAGFALWYGWLGPMLIP